MASKRKHDEAFEGPVDDAGPPGRLPRATQEIVTYFEELKSNFDSLDDKEEQSLLVANALEEASGQECAVATDAACSRVLEALLPCAEPQQLAKFFQAVLKGDGLMAMASRYCAILLHSIAKQKSVTQHHLRSRYHTDHCWRFACSPFGSHVLEVLMIQLTKPQQSTEDSSFPVEEVSILLMPRQLRTTLPL